MFLVRAIRHALLQPGHRLFPLPLDLTFVIGNPAPLLVLFRLVFHLPVIPAEVGSEYPSS